MAPVSSGPSRKGSRFIVITLTDACEVPSSGIEGIPRGRYLPYGQETGTVEVDKMEGLPDRRRGHLDRRCRGTARCHRDRAQRSEPSAWAER
jgi:hypothetical protein